MGASAAAFLLLASPVHALTGGDPASGDTYPWVASLLHGRGNAPSTAFFCGGALIHPSWVLTAAHCVEDRAPNAFEVVFGVGDLTQPIERAHRYGVAEIFIQPHYLYRDGRFDGDLALLRLSRPVTDREPVRILEQNLRLEGTATAVAWTEGAADRALNTLEINVVSRLQAASATGQGIDLDAVPVNASVEATGLCHGDSGSPLIRVVDGETRLLGVASYVVEECGAYAVYANLQFYRDWILALAFPAFDRWRASYSIGALWGDEDNDGLSNFVEFARGTHPRQPTVGAATTRPVVDGEGRPGIEFVHHAAADFTVEVSPDLVAWDALDPAQILLREPNGTVEGTEKILAVSEEPLEELTQKFFRVTSAVASEPREPIRRVGRDFYVKLDAPTVLGTGDKEARYELTGLLDGTTVFVLTAPFFAPRFLLVDQASGEVLVDAGDGVQRVFDVEFPTESGKTYELVLSSFEENPTGWMSLQFPRESRIPFSIQLGRQPAAGVLNEFSDFNGNFYGQAYRIFGAFAGDTATMTLFSDPEEGGFRPFLLIQNDLGEVVAFTEGEPTTETTVSFVLEANRVYFAFASTLLPGAQGLFTLAGVRN